MIFFVGLGDFSGQLVELGEMVCGDVLVAGSDTWRNLLGDPKGFIRELVNFPDFSIVADPIHLKGLQDPWWVGNSGCHCWKRELVRTRTCTDENLCGRETTK